METIIIDYKNKYVLIRVNLTYIYDISFDKLRKHEDWWLNHLSAKRWFGSDKKVNWDKVVKELKENNYGKSASREWTH